MPARKSAAGSESTYDAVSSRAPNAGAGIVGNATFFLVRFELYIANLVVGAERFEVVSHVNKVQASDKLLGELPERR